MHYERTDSYKLVQFENVSITINYYKDTEFLLLILLKGEKCYRVHSLQGHF